MKVALVHYWLNGMRGGEKVLEAFCELFPDAPIHVLFHEPAKVSELINSRDVRASGLNRFGILRKFYKNLFPFFPLATEQFDLREFYLLLSSDAICMKGVITSPDCLHVCYCHSPPRYVWDMYFEYLENARLGRLKRYLARRYLHKLRLWDAVAANRVDYFIANSHYVAQRIAKYYRRQAAVVHPPVDWGAFGIGDPGGYYLSLGELVPYKRIDLLVEAFNRMPDRELVIVGMGPRLNELRKRAHGNTRFVGWQEDAAVREYLAGCRAFLFPGLEDYGITPLEAQACGRPVIAYGKGGVVDTVPAVTVRSAHLFDGDKHAGLFFASQTPEAIVEAVEKFEESVEARVDPAGIRERTARFDRSHFIAAIERSLVRMHEEFVESGPPTFDE